MQVATELFIVLCSKYSQFIFTIFVIILSILYPKVIPNLNLFLSFHIITISIFEYSNAFKNVFKKTSFFTRKDWSQDMDTGGHKRLGHKCPGHKRSSHKRPITGLSNKKKVTKNLIFFLVWQKLNGWAQPDSNPPLDL